MNLSQIEMSQLKLITRGIRFIKKGHKQGYNVESSPFFYLNSWAHVPGYFILKNWQTGVKSNFFNFHILIKSYFALNKLSNIDVKGGHSSEIVSYNTLFFSWCRKGDFVEQKYYFDKYFKTSPSKTRNTIWFLISVDNYCPPKLESNVFLLRRLKGKSLGHELLFLVSRTGKEIFRNRFNLVKVIHKLNSATIFSDFVAKKIIEITNNNGIKNVWGPYEAQPLQNNIFFNLKKNNPKILTKGYLHSALPPLMTDLIFRKGAPDNLYIHGEGQIEILNKYLNWPKSSLIKIKSLRYIKEDSWDMSGYIFLPYDFFNLRYYLEKFEKFLIMAEKNSLPFLKVRNHPQASNSKKHLDLAVRLEGIILRYQNRMKSENRRKISVFFGATAAILEALEYHIEVIHIVSDAVFESHSSFLWKDINVELIENNVFKYRLLESKKYIDFGDNKDEILNYLD